MLALVLTFVTSGEPMFDYSLRASAPFLLFAFHFLLYLVVHYVFLDFSSRREWMGRFLEILAVISIALIALLFIEQYTPFVHKNIRNFLICIVCIYEFLTILAQIKLYFIKKFGSLGIILYFCTVQIAPLLVIIRL